MGFVAPLGAAGVQGGRVRWCAPVSLPGWTSGEGTGGLGWGGGVAWSSPTPMGSSWCATPGIGAVDRGRFEG